MKIEDPPPDVFTTPCTPSKEFENDCASMDQPKLECIILWLTWVEQGSIHACIIIFFFVKNPFL
jgi:hypothetical protein